MKVLGVSANYHDASAALVVDGQVVFSAAEERFSRVKHDPTLPLGAVRACLEEARLRPEDLSLVAYHEDPPTKLSRALATSLARVDNVRVAPILTDLANDRGLPTKARVAAVRALGNVAVGDRAVRTALIGLLETRDARLRRAAVNSLVAFDDAVANGALARHYERSVVPREKRAIEATFGR